MISIRQFIRKFTSHVSPTNASRENKQLTLAILKPDLMQHPPNLRSSVATNANILKGVGINFLRAKVWSENTMGMQKVDI